MSLRSELANNLSELEKLNHSDKFILRPIISWCGAEKMNTCTHLHTKIARYNLSVTAAAGVHLWGFFLSFFFPLFFSLLPSRPLWACFPTPCPLRLIRTARNNTRGEEEGMSKTQQGGKKREQHLDAMGAEIKWLRGEQHLQGGKHPEEQVQLTSCTWNSSSILLVRQLSWGSQRVRLPNRMHVFCVCC